ncbi:recombinase family protein [Sporobacter termitidis]|uniref:recombinase family protein n=1 Tax=Sporobacter termitidis TaxID=44749 RepID=UPI00241FC3C0|nr:recombinase family protein [Sporobacter termitidis]
MRISRDDGEEGDSNSIQTQKKLLTKVAKEKGYTELLVFSDDGVTGTTMKRPGFQAMIQEIERATSGPCSSRIYPAWDAITGKPAITWKNFSRITMYALLPFPMALTPPRARTN